MKMKILSIMALLAVPALAQQQPAENSDSDCVLPSAPIIGTEFNVRLPGVPLNCLLAPNHAGVYECIRLYLTAEDMRFQDFLIQERELLEGYLSLPAEELNDLVDGSCVPTFLGDNYYQVSDYIGSYEILRADLDESFPNYEQTRARMDANIISMRAYQEDLLEKSHQIVSGNVCVKYPNLCPYRN